MKTRFTTRNDVVVKKGGDAGVCAAMVCRWIQNVRVTRAATERHHVGSPAELKILQWSYLADEGEIKSMKGLMERCGLSGRLLGLDEASIPAATLTHCVRNAIAASTGFLLVEILSESGGHAVGLRLQPPFFEGLEPNTGLYSLDDAGDAQKWWNIAMEATEQEVLKEKATSGRVYLIPALR